MALENAILISQLYEWVTMLSIIRLQKGKTMQQMLYLLNNTKALSNFQRNEKIFRVCYYILLIFVCGIMTLNHMYFQYFKIQNGLNKDTFHFFNRLYYVNIRQLLSISIFNITLFCLLCQLKRYYNYQYKKHVKSMVFFGIIEALSCLLTIRYFEKYINFMSTLSDYSGIRFFLVSLAFIYFKPNEDPF